MQLWMLVRTELWGLDLKILGSPVRLGDMTRKKEGWSKR